MTRGEIIRAVRGIILRHARPERIWLYGSEAEGTAGKESDIDIAFLDPEINDLGPITAEVESLAAW